MEKTVPKKKKSWTEKLADNKDLPRVEKMSRKWGKGTVVIPAPMEVDEMMRKVPKGRLVTINDIREALARRHSATIGCPMTTGIFASIAANAADEQRQRGTKDITPYWRTLKGGGVINPKYPGGAEGQTQLLEKEGHRVIQKGKRFVIADFEKSLITL